MQALRLLRHLFWAAILPMAAAAPATSPSPPQTGEITLKFTQRSPLSSLKELARRLSCKESDLAKSDYDLTTFTFRTYIPPNYDPSAPYGVFVYLGNHDVSSVPTRWEPLFDKSHMIFIAPDWHSPMVEPQLIGLGFDAVDNLQRLYNIDTHRLYDMWFNSGSLQMALAGADVYTGMIVGEDWNYFRKINLPGNRFHAADFSPPPPALLQKAKPHGVVVIALAPPDVGAGIISKALKEDGFDNVLCISQTYEELHYPNYAASWITDPVLPFLDKAAQEKPVAHSDSPKPTSAPSPSVVAAASVPAPPSSRTESSTSSEAQHVLSMAQLYINNGNTELARTKLRDILTNYPKDPAAISAKKLLDSLTSPDSPQQ